MTFTLKNLVTSLSADILTQAKKNKVRECDETEKGHFVAYVDEGAESYDVSLALKNNGEIVGHTCDCENADRFCRHKAALAMYISKDKKTEKVVKAGKKESEVDILLGNIDPSTLKQWVKELIGKNKDLELSFINRFSVKAQPTPEEVVKIINNAAKAVIGAKKTVETAQLKKLVDLWSEILEPVITYYRTGVADEKSFLNFHTMIDTCEGFQLKFYTVSNKIPKFIETMLLKSVTAINDLHVEAAWDKSVGFFISRVPDGKNTIRMYYLQHLKNIIEISDQERKVKIIGWLADQFKRLKPDTLINGPEYTKFIFDLIEENEQFPKYSNLFKPIRFNNDYNLKLIGSLIENNNLDIAKKYCVEQINSNLKEEYSIPYLKFLKEIYLVQKDETGLARVTEILFPYTFNFDDYIFILKRMPEEERKKWRTKMLTKSRNANYSYKNSAMDFYFKLADEEKKYNKMIEYIDSSTPYSIIFHYFEKMLQADRNKLLETVLRKSNSYGLGRESKNEKEDVVFIPQLFDLFKKHYQSDYLKIAITNFEKNRWNLNNNELIVYIKQQLSM